MRWTIGMVVAAVLLGGAGRTEAHDLWWAREDGGFALRYGHLPGAHEGARILDYEVSDVARVLGLAADGGIREVAVPENEGAVRVEGRWAALSAEMAPVIWTKTPYGTVRAPKDETDMPVDSWESRESTKRIERWRPELVEPLGEGFEIVPTRDPTGRRPGDKLRVCVMLAGEPVAGATVAYDGSPRGVSGKDGRVNLKLRHGGLQNIQASLEEPQDGIRRDRIVRTAALVFEVEEKE